MTFGGQVVHVTIDSRDTIRIVKEELVLPISYPFYGLEIPYIVVITLFHPYLARQAPIRAFVPPTRF
jgi:hypothetical protein